MFEDEERSKTPPHAHEDSEVHEDTAPSPTYVLIAYISSIIGVFLVAVAVAELLHAVLS